MARRKRPYVPKVKGCYECSQRRIDCDRTGPSCNKCSSRGLSCSGFGVKYRFRNGFAPGHKTPSSKSRSSNPYASTTSQASPETASVSPASVDSEGGGGQTYGWYTDGHGTDGHDRGGTGAGLSPVSVGFSSHVLSHPHLPSSGEMGATIPTTTTTTTYGVNMFDHHRTQDGSSPATYSSDMILEAFIETGGSQLSFAPPQEPEEPPCDTYEAACHKTTTVYEEPSRPHGDDRDVFDIIAEYTSILGSEETTASPPSHGSEEKSDLGSTEVLLGQPPVMMPTASHWYTHGPLAAGLAQISPSKQFLLKHFSDRIAPEMVVMDDEHNGWRHLVLTIALTDDLVMSAVLAASAFHVSASNGSALQSTDMLMAEEVHPRELYAQAIRKLQHRRELNGCDPETRQMVILAIVILLVAVMINGCSDFPVMFRMLQSALDAIGGESGLIEDGGEVAAFSLRQIRKMRVYAAPLLSQDDGLQALVSQQASQSFECLQYYRRLYPEHSSTFDILADLRQQAFNIYVDRVLNPDTSHDGDKVQPPSSNAHIEAFIRTLESFPPGSPGEHVLIWPCFIAASESKEPEDRLYFQNFLSKQYIRNGFSNILIALNFLHKIWAEGSSNVDWPALLPEPQVFIM